MLFVGSVLGEISVNFLSKILLLRSMLSLYIGSVVSRMKSGIANLSLIFRILSIYYFKNALFAW